MLSTELHHGCLDTVDTTPLPQPEYVINPQQVRHPHVSDPVVFGGTDSPIDTSIQRCAGTNSRGPDIWYTCPPCARPSQGSATPSWNSSALSLSLIDLPVIHEHPLRHGHDDADFDANTPLPCSVLIGVCPRSRTSQASQTPVVSDTKDRAAIAPATVFWMQRMPFLMGNKTTNGHDLSPPPSFPLYRPWTRFSSHLNSPPMPLTLRVKVLSYSGTPPPTLFQ